MTEKELQTIYNAIMNKEVNKAQELVESGYLSRYQVLSYLNNYAKTKSQEEQEIYKSKYEFFLASYYPYFKTVMSLIEELANTETINFDGYTSFREINQDLLRFKKKFPEYAKIIDTIKLLIEKAKIKNKEVRKIDNFFNPRYEKKSHYEDDFYMIATSENPISVLKDYNWTEKQFYDKLNLFKKKYPLGEDDGLAEKFENWFKQYLKLYKQEKLEQEFEERNDDFIVSQSIVKDLIASRMSIYEYCDHEPGYTYSDIKNYIMTYFGEYKIEKPKIREFIETIEDREDSKFNTKLYNIACKIIYDENYTVLDYYLDTFLDINDFMKKVEVKHPKLSQFAAQNFNTSRNNFGKKSWQIIAKEFNRQQELKVTRIIKEKLITLEEKEAIFKYFDENQIPLNTYTYHAALNKLVNNDLEFNQKINTYKKGSI